MAATWLGILLAYDSYYWGPGHHSLPVSFFIVAIVFATYLAAGLPAARAAERQRTATPVTRAANIAARSRHETRARPHAGRRPDVSRAS